MLTLPIRQRWAFARLAFTVGAGVIAGAPVAAQGVPRPPSTVAVDPPGRVGRLALLDGAVSYQPASDTGWTGAVPNRPITTGDRLWADNGARGEVEIGSATVRIWQETELDVTRLDDHAIQLRLPQGSVVLRVHTLPYGDDAEIDAPNATVTARTIGEYRVGVSPDGQTTTVTVWSGSAEVTAAGSSFALAAHQVATVRGTDSPTYDVAEAGDLDQFDNWSRTRDDREDRVSNARRYVASDMAGADDLDDYGDWNNEVDYGAVWYPRVVDTDWAPYHYGHWVWVGPWGWTWVDDSPWGWAPFHYGRWAYVHDRWGWCPGRVIVQPVYAPALVVFIGGGGSEDGVFGSEGGVGWFPLGPEEIYRPAYPASYTYVQRVNVTNVTNTTNITNITNVTNYRNRTVAGAVTAIPRSAFENAAPVAKSAAHLPEVDVRQAAVIGASPRIVPTAASLVYRSAGRAATAPPTTLEQRPVLATHAPPPPPVLFSAQARALATNGGQPLTPQQLNSIRHTAPTASPGSAPAVRILPVRSSAVQLHGANLTPARPGLPEAQPTLKTGGAPPRPMTPPPPTGARPPGGGPFSHTPPAAAEPARTPPATQGAPSGERVPAPSMRPPVARPPAPPGSRSLNASYADQRTQMEARHVQQFAQPPAGILPSRLAEQQDFEHRQLDAQYHRAAITGQRAMPTMAPRSAPPTALRPAQQPRPAPRPK